MNARAATDLGHAATAAAPMPAAPGVDVTAAHGTQVSAEALAGVLHLAQRAQAAATPAELAFTMANETLSLVEFRQSAFFTAGANGRRRLSTASGLASVADDSPYAVWLGRFAASLPTAPGLHRLDHAEARPEFVEGWAEWLPDHLLAAPLHASDGAPLGLMLYARDEPWSDADLALLGAVHRHYAYCLAALKLKRPGPLGRLGRALASKWLWALPLLGLTMLIPVRLSALAPAEVVALNSVAVAAPQDGVIHQFHVAPNAAVQAGDLLFSLDDTTLKSRRDVAAKGLTIARADALVFQQRAFDDVKSKGELAAAFGRVREKEAELALIDSALARIDVRADRAGVAVFADANDWLGRPVQTGERVLQLADPGDAGVLMWLPAADALNLEPGAPMKLFLHTQPLDPLAARLLQTSYQAVPSPEGVASYRLRAAFDAPAAGAAVPRIGLRGTARVSGDWSVLGYYVFRRPIAAVREWTGL